MRLQKNGRLGSREVTSPTVSKPKVARTSLVTNLDRRVILSRFQTQTIVELTGRDSVAHGTPKKSPENLNKRVKSGCIGTMAAAGNAVKHRGATQSTPVVRLT